MNYEEKYKQALEAVDEILNSGLDSIPMSRLKLRLQPFFIELKESEDEKIRKALIRLIESATEGKYGISEFKVDGFCRDKLLTWLEKQKTSEEALQYLKENHSPSEMSDFQAAMNIAVAKSYDKGYNDALEKQGEQKSINDTDEEIVEAVKDTSVLDLVEPKPAWNEEDEEKLNQLHKLIVKKAYEEYEIDTDDETLYGKWLELDNWLKSLKDMFVIPKEDKVICINKKGIVPKKEPEGTLKQLLDEYSVDDLEMENLMMAVDDFLEEHPEHIEEFKNNYIKRFGDTTINQWKPSEWQLKKLYYAMHNFGGETFKVLNSLYNDLKKL